MFVCCASQKFVNWVWIPIYWKMPRIDWIGFSCSFFFFYCCCCCWLLSSSSPCMMLYRVLLGWGTSIVSTTIVLALCSYRQPAKVFNEMFGFESIEIKKKIQKTKKKWWKKKQYNEKRNGHRPSIDRHIHKNSVLYYVYLLLPIASVACSWRYCYCRRHWHGCGRRCICALGQRRMRFDKWFHSSWVHVCTTV